MKEVKAKQELDVLINPPWHSQGKEEIFEKLKTSEDGLTQGKAEKRLREYGINEISEKRKTLAIFNFLKQFNSPLIYILFVAIIISFIFHHLIDAYVIIAVVLVNVSISFIQERKAEKAISALKKLVISYAKVYRDGEIKKIPSREVVPGDIIVLEEGDKVPADARLIEVKNFRTQESSLTGESFPQEKKLGVLDESTILSDRTNMVFMSTLVVSGEAKAVVVSTANNTAIGQVAKSIQEVVQPKMHFNEKVTQLTLQMALFALIGALLTFFIGFFFNKLEFFEIFLFTIASLVSGIPEGLPAVLVIVLAVGARRMAKRNAIIRHLPAVETLGVVTVIAADKTGTITKNSINVEDIITPDGNFKVTGNGWEPIGRFFQNNKTINPRRISILQKVLSISALCNKGNLLRKDGEYEIIGDPTEVALLVVAKKAGFNREELNEKLIDDFPFSSDLKFRASLIESASKKRELYVVGAFETILNRSSYILKSGRKIRIDESVKQEFLKKAELLAKKGKRVLALSYKEVPRNINSVSKELVNNLIFVGLVGMEDPPRPEIKESIKKARNAGIRIIMKTGDHKETALAIAKKIGLITGKAEVLTEEDLQKLSKKGFDEAVSRVNIFARVTPKMKMKIINSLQEKGEIVAMTGDGINDAPALKKADIGIAMGRIGTDVARESSEMVLADDNFASIVNAIEEGRIVFQNVRQTSFYLITTNIAEDITIVSSLALGFPLPMIPIQVLYLNLVTDTFNGVALARESGHHDVLNQPPRSKKEKILNKELIPFLLLMVGLMVLGTIPLFRHFLPQGIDKARTVAFVSMSMFQLFNVFNMRSLKRSLFNIGIFSNKWITFGLMASFLLMLGVIYIPWLQGIFRFVPLAIGEFLIIILIASSVFVVGEIYKKIRYKNEKDKKKTKVNLKKINWKILIISLMSFI
ncbi:cation-transporting ATPase [Candidatus Pacearchaeota archaeon]|nr:MAG: cation-transporting ATPase [Candidatus Pacearchaeota archaeon]